MIKMDDQNFDELFEKIMGALTKKQLQNDNNEANEKINEITKRFSKFLKEPYSFRVLKEIGNALRSKDPFYVKYLRVKAPVFDFDKLVKIASADDELKKHIDTSKDYDVYIRDFQTVISPKDERRTVVVTPMAIFGVNAKFETVKRVTSQGVFSISPSLYPPPEATGIFMLSRHWLFDPGCIEIFGKNHDNVGSVISDVAKKQYPWKKKKVEVTTSMYKNLVGKKFRDKDYLIDRTDVLYKGNLKEKYITIFPSEKISVHIGKILRFYFDKKRVQRQIKLLDNSIDITDIQLPGLKKRKIKVKDKVEKIMKPYNDIVEIDKTDDDKPFEIIPHKINPGSIRTELLFMLAYKEKNGEDVALNELHFYPDWISAKRNIIYIFSDSILKISKKQFQGISNSDIVYNISKNDYKMYDKTKEIIRRTIFEKFGLKPEDVTVDYYNFYDGTIFAVNKPVGYNKLSWLRKGLLTKTSNKNTLKLFANKRDRIIWVEKREMEKFKKEMLKEKYGKRF